MIRHKYAKDYLEESAIELFSKYPIEKVTISDICSNSQLSARTYYNYFKDKYDIITHCCLDRFESYIHKHAENMTFHDLMVYLSREVYKQPDFFRNIFRYKGQNNIRLSAAEPLRNLYMEVIEKHNHISMNQEEKDALLFYLYGILAYVEVVLNQSVLPPAEQPTAFCENAVPEILQKYL